MTDLYEQHLSEHVKRYVKFMICLCWLLGLFFAVLQRELAAFGALHVAFLPFLLVLDFCYAALMMKKPILLKGYDLTKAKIFRRRLLER